MTDSRHGGALFKDRLMQRPLTTHSLNIQPVNAMNVDDDAFKRPCLSGNSMTHLARVWILICLMSGVCACDPPPADVSRARTAAPLYQGAQKRWIHRANSIKKAKIALATYPGVEVDVVFEDGAFDVRHDTFGTPSGLTLDAYFSTLSEYPEAFYWLDLKNLRFWNDDAALERMTKILKKHGLIERAIVESQNISGLARMSRAGIKTSYWFPHFKYDPKNMEAYRHKARDLAGVLKLHEFNAVSCHKRMVAFLRHFFPNISVHIWTTGTYPDQPSEELDELVKWDALRVALVSAPKTN